MQRFRPILYLCILAIIFVSFKVGLTITAAAQSPSCAWNIVPSPNPGPMNNYLYSVAASSPNNAWAVGHTEAQTLIEQWNGTSWSRVSSPSPGVSNLEGIVALSANNAWAVGNSASSKNGSFPKTLVEHWNGKKWSVSTSPNAGTGNNQLFGVAAVSPRDIWAVGEANDKGSGFTRTLIEHWNGSRWTVFSSPNLGAGSSYLASVATVSTNDVWAVGSGTSLANSPMQTLIEHWNGTSWSIVPSPNAGQGDNGLSGVAVASASDIFAVGGAMASSNSLNQALIEHWNGSNWSITSSPTEASFSNSLSGITRTSSTDAWAVGDSTDGRSNSTLIEHWDGTSWNIISSPNPTASSDMLGGITSIPTTNELWAVGSYQISSGATQTLIEVGCF